MVMADMEEVAPETPSVVQIDLQPCGICGRTFAPKTLAKHEQICQKQAVKKRKPFNSLAQRVAGTDLADFHMPTYLKKGEGEGGENVSTEIVVPDIPIKAEVETVKPSKQGREKAEKHVAPPSKLEKTVSRPSIIEDTPLKGYENTPTKTTKLVREATEIKGTQNTVTPKRAKGSLKAAIMALASQGEKCPTCERTFNAKAFERHVDWCKERNNVNRCQQSPASLQMAKERLLARQNYRAPVLLAKAQRQINKEKYSTNKSSKQNSSEDETSMLSPSSLTRSPSIRRESVTSLQRGNSIRRPSPQSVSMKPVSPARYEDNHLENGKQLRQKKMSRGKSSPIASCHDLLEEKTAQRNYDPEVTPSIMR